MNKQFRAPFLLFTLKVPSRFLGRIKWADSRGCCCLFSPVTYADTWASYFRWTIPCCFPARIRKCFFKENLNYIMKNQFQSEAISIGYLTTLKSRQKLGYWVNFWKLVRKMERSKGKKKTYKWEFCSSSCLKHAILNIGIVYHWAFKLSGQI